MAVENLNQAQQLVGLIQRIAADMGAAKQQNSLEAVPQLFELIRSALLDNPINTKSIVMEQSNGYELIGNPVVFTSVDYGTEVDIIIPGVLEITRDDSKGLYNVAQEVSYDNSGYTSPLGTEWNSDFTDPILFGWGDLSNLADRTYGTWTDAHGYNPAGTIGVEQIMHETITGRYFKFKLLQWTGGASGGGFGYERQEIELTPVATITFPDGSTMSTAPGAGVDTDSWKVPGVAFVDPANGDDFTGVVGDGNKPYRSLVTAENNSDYIICLPGLYFGNQTLKTNKRIHFMQGARINGFSKLVDGGVAATNCYVTGDLEFAPNSRGIEFTAASDVSIICQRFDNVQSVAALLGGGRVHIKTRSILANCVNGGGYACTPRNGGEIILEVSEFCHTQHWLVAPRGDGCKFTLKCPDVKILNNYTSNYGNTAKSIVNSQFGNTYTVTIDLMGGRFINEHPTQAVSFGVADTSCLLMVNSYNQPIGPTMIFKNGTFDAGPQAAIGYYYITDSGTIILENAKFKSQAQAIRQWNANSAGTRRGIWQVTNCEFESQLPNVIGNTTQMYFRKCTFKVASGQGSIFAFNNTNATFPGEYYFMDCYGQLDVGGGEFLATGAATMTIGFLNTNSSEPLELFPIVTDIYGGYNEVAALTLPNIK